MTDDDLRREVKRLRKEVNALHHRLDALEESDAEAPTHRRNLPEQRPEAKTAAQSTGTAGARAERAADTTEAPDQSADTTDEGRDWELAVGVHWLGIVGALALVVGVVFFIRLAIEMGLLGPLGRVTAGTLGGLLLFGGGRFAAVRQGYVRWGRLAAGAGLAIAYFSLYAAYGFESYRAVIGTPLWATLLALTVLIAGTAAISVRDGAPVVAGEAFLLGYVTAYLSIEAATLVVTPVYALLLAAGLVTIATVKPWSGLVLASVVPTYTVVGLWVLDIDPPATAVAVVTAVAFLVYLGGRYTLGASREREGRGSTVQLVALSVSNAAFAALFFEYALRTLTESPDLAGVGTGLVVVALVSFYVLTDRMPTRCDGAAATLAVVGLPVAVWQATEPFWTTVASLAVLGGAVGIATIEDAPEIRLGAHLVAAGVAVKLLVVDARELPPFNLEALRATLTGRPVAFLFAVAVFYALAWWFTVEEASLTEYERSDRLSVGGVYAATGTGLAVVALGLELSGVGVSVAWALFGILLLGAGFYADLRGVRFLGIGVLGLATVKVFLVDTRGLDTVARTLSFLVLGVVLLVASYAYARSQDDVEIGLGLGEND